MAPPTQQSVHMNGGEGGTSYSKNSTLQRRVQQKLAPVVDTAAADLFRDDAGTLRSIGIADLGCSSGPNTLFLVSAAINAVRRRCVQLAGLGHGPELRVFLNDLPGNDFNAVFRQLPAFLRREQEEPQFDAGSSLGPVLIFGAPASVFGRLFPGGSMHLVCFFFSLHWLSQVPREVADVEMVNKGNICAGRTSPPTVLDSYARKFSKDFTLFLKSRAEEVVAGGWVLLSLKGRSTRDPRSDDYIMYDHLTNVLNDMAAMVRTLMCFDRKS